MNKDLEDIFKEDQADRIDKESVWSNQELMQEVNLRDKARRSKVKNLIDQNLLRDGADFYHAAMVYQHGDTSEDYQLANQLAEKGMTLGTDGELYHESCKWIYAASLDRYLLSIGERQKYGTQFIKNNKGEWELSPLNPDTTDKEREKYHVPPLSQPLIPHNLDPRP